MLRWQLSPSGQLHWRQWDEEYLLFNAASGQTHFLNELGAGALQLLQQSPLSVVELSERLAALYELELDAKLQAYINRMVADLGRLGLIEPCTDETG